ncbi:MAG TPA: LysM peptidoglycan-binding domain-containing protein [Pseudomonadales bacterium]|nr:LysM peptidoglycan-binding domain-containing protein [Pseudomonadales bacterium]
MNNPNPFVPKGSLLEQQSKRRAGLKLGVFCVLAIGVTSLAAMLIQGCKREETDQNAENNGTPMVDTNNYAAADTNVPPVEASNPPVAAVPPTPVPATPAPTPPPAPAAPSETEYVVVKGDTLGKIAKANSVTVKAIEDANPGVQPARLKVGQKLVIPGGTGAAGTTGVSAAQETANGVATNTGGDQAYTVKSGDTLTRIARHFGVTLKALMAENNLTTTHIKVGQKLNIPAKPEATPAPVNTPPASAPEPQPVTPAPQTSPSTVPEAPAPQSSTPPQQQSMR